MPNQLDIDKINKMVDNTLDLQNQAVNAINGINPGRKIKVFDPRNEKDIVSEDGKVIWTTKSIEIALKALKDGYSLRKSPFFRGDTSLRKADLNFQYTQEELLEVIKCKNDIVYFANNYVFLKTGEGRKRIKLRPYQIKVLKQMQDERFSILLQSRQTGKTTTTSIFFAWMLSFHTDKTAAIIANKESIAAEVFSKVKGVISYMPFFLKPGCYNFGTSSFSFDNGSRALYRTATIDAIQGFSIDIMFIDEFAYIKNTKARDFWVNAYPTISSIPDSKVIIASTPNGRNLYWELWEGAISKKNRFVPFRVDYWMVPGHGPEWVEQEKANIGEEGFAQQYGLSFDTKMRSVLSQETHQFLNKIEQKFEPGLLPIGTQFDTKFRWSTKFKYSLRKDWYILSIDIGEGLLQDSSVIKIKKLVKMDENRYRLITVGIFESDDIQIPDFAEVIVQLSRRLNLDKTRIIVERNTYGDLLMVHINNIEDKLIDGFEIPLESYAKFKRKEGSKLEKGLRLNSAYKKFGVAAYKEFINSQFNIETDSLSIQQMREFGEDEKGNFKAAIGHDDLVMPEVNLSFFIKSDETGWREFKQDFLDESEIDTYNIKVIRSLNLNADKLIRLEITDDLDDSEFNEYSKFADLVGDKDEEISIFGTIDREKRKKILENAEDEYSLAAKMVKPRADIKPKGIYDTNYKRVNNLRSTDFDPKNLIDLI